MLQKYQFISCKNMKWAISPTFSSLNLIWITAYFLTYLKASLPATATYVSYGWNWMTDGGLGHRVLKTWDSSLPVTILRCSSLASQRSALLRWYLKWISQFRIAKIQMLRGYIVPSVPTHYTNTKPALQSSDLWSISKQITGPVTFN